MGSVKDLTVYEKASDSELGRGDFTFSDRFSVFDWGEMPDQIPYKGQVLCLMTAWNFEKLGENGFRSHCLGVRNRASEVVGLNEIGAPTNMMAVTLSRVIEPGFNNGEFDYSYFVDGRGGINNFVVPLEVIYRNGAPRGSSLFKTLDKLEAEEKIYEIRD